MKLGKRQLTASVTTLRS